MPVVVNESLKFGDGTLDDFSDSTQVGRVTPLGGGQVTVAPVTDLGANPQTWDGALLKAGAEAALAKQLTAPAGFSDELAEGGSNDPSIAYDNEANRFLVKKVTESVSYKRPTLEGLVLALVAAGF